MRRKASPVTSLASTPATRRRRPAPTPASAAPPRSSAASAAATYPLGARYACEECFGPLEVALRRVARAVTRADDRGRARRRSGATPRCCRSRPTPAGRVDLGAGLTRLLRADRLAAALGMRRAVGQGRQRQPDPLVQGPGRRGRADRGARARLQARSRARPPATSPTPSPRPPPAPGCARSCSIPRDLEQGKIVTTAVYGGTLVAVEGNYDDVNRLCSEVAVRARRLGVRQRQRCGRSTPRAPRPLGYEVAEQLGWRLPEQVVSPIASGSLLTKVDKALRELGALGLVEATPYQVFGAQATGCSPVVAGVRGRPRRRPAGASPTPSPSRWPSATRPTGRTRSTSCAAPAARSPTSPTTRSSRASGCSRGPRASSPRPRAA